MEMQGALDFPVDITERDARNVRINYVSATDCMRTIIAWRKRRQCRLPGIQHHRACGPGEPHHRLLLNNIEHQGQKQAQAASEHRQPMDLLLSLSACMYPCHTHMPRIHTTPFEPVGACERLGAPASGLSSCAPMTRYGLSSPVCQSR